MSRFYVPTSRWANDKVVMEESEGRHAVEVLRLKIGDEVSLFDGEGRIARARLAQAGKRLVEAEIVSCESVAKPAAQITLYQAIPKGKLFEWILEKSVELGVSRVVPLLTERTVVSLDEKEGVRKREKWERVVVEACKQSGQNWMPEVTVPVRLPVALREMLSGVSIAASLHPGAVHLCDALPSPLTSDASAWIGPEGDFTPLEMERIVEWGAQPVTLGKIILKVETAAMYCLSVLSHSR